MSAFQDRDYLQRSQYRTSNHLTARADLHARFNVSAEEWHPWVLEQLALQPGEQILECGTGPGWLWESPGAVPTEGRLVITDLSAGMVSEACMRLRGLPVPVVGVTADIQDLPFPANSFDVVVANHMLYHVPDIPRALREVARILRPDGRFAAATNGRGHLRELFQLSEAVFPNAPISIRVAMGTLPFALENGADLISEVFSKVNLRLYESRLEVDNAEALVNYMLSSAEAQANVPSEERERGGAIIDERIRALGPIRISKETGLFLAELPIKDR